MPSLLSFARPNLGIPLAARSRAPSGTRICCVITRTRRTIFSTAPFSVRRYVVVVLMPSASGPSSEGAGSSAGRVATEPPLNVSSPHDDDCAPAPLGRDIVGRELLQGNTK
jgi:hypothetical protein